MLIKASKIVGFRGGALTKVGEIVEIDESPGNLLIEVKAAELVDNAGGEPVRKIEAFSVSKPQIANRR